MRESRTPGSVRGVLSNEHPYRDRASHMSVLMRVRRCGRAFGLGIVAMSRAGRGLIQPLDIVNVFHVSLHDRAPGLDIIRVKFRFRQGFFEM